MQNVTMKLGWLCVLATAGAGCVGARGELETGTVAIHLTGSAATGTVYRLRDAIVTVDGPGACQRNGGNESAFRGALHSQLAAHGDDVAPACPVVLDNEACARCRECRLSNEPVRGAYGGFVAACKACGRAQGAVRDFDFNRLRTGEAAPSSEDDPILATDALLRSHALRGRGSGGKD